MSQTAKYCYDLIVKKWKSRRRFTAIFIAVLAIPLIGFFWYVAHQDQFNRGVILAKYWINAGARKLAQATQESTLKEQDNQAARPAGWVAPEVYNAVTARLKDAEAKFSRANNQLDTLRLELKQSEGRVNQLSKEFDETKSTLGKAMRDLQSVKEENQKLSVQLAEMKKTLDASVFTRKKIQALVQELTRVEFARAFPRNSGGTVDLYNTILRSLKKELPNDFYVQDSKELDPSTDWAILAPILGNTSSQLKGYLETTYLK
jgi:archaellum component FlaC